MDVEPTIALLEAATGEIKVSLARIEERLAVTATSAQVEALRGDVGKEVNYLRGRIEMLPRTWVMLVAVVGGQVALASLKAAIIFGLGHVMGQV